MPRPDFHVLVCAQQRPPGHPRNSCGQRGAAGLVDAFSKGLISRNLMNNVSLVPTMCLGPCQAGANVLVFPGAHMYMDVKADDVDQIIEKHLVSGEPVAEKLAPAEVW